jgi:hypothetical protein
MVRPPFRGGLESVSPVASPSAKDVKTMPTQKTFKTRVRTRMSKTGESYTTARHQLLRKASDTGPVALEPTPPPEPTASTTPATATTTTLTSDEAMVRATGRPHADWFALLDAWGGTDHTHTEIARWLHDGHGVPGWWSQNVTVAYERARGMRAPHELPGGFSVGVSKTVALSADRALAAFTDPAQRRRWLTGASMRQRPTRAANTARFDWADPPAIVVVSILPKGPTKSTINVTTEKLPDAVSVERLRMAWRTWLAQLRSQLED